MGIVGPGNDRQQKFGNATLNVILKPHQMTKVSKGELRDERYAPNLQIYDKHWPKERRHPLALSTSVAAD